MAEKEKFGGNFKDEVDAAKSNIDTMNKDIPTSLADVADFRF